ncbi:MAG TPA: ATP-dependent 6-phosphofructokinase [Verrucomicrobiae bacterium]|nr:ATP-dependent 6-phosphofructokinase [Verrucomicrobiae bacterium]
MRVGVLTGGGDSAGLNAAIRAVARCTFADGGTVVGIHNGWAGLTGAGDMRDLVPHDVSGILTLGGTILGSSRVNPLADPETMAAVRGNLARSGLDALVTIGGDDTLRVANALAAGGAPVVGVPKTMDNDLQVTEYCIGFDSAVAVVTEAVDRLHTTAASHHRVMVVEVMGRDTGWVALMGGIAGGADMIVIPEFPVAVDTIAEHLDRRRGRGREFSIIVVAEGADVAGLAPVDLSQAPRDSFGHVQLSRRGVGDRLGAQIEALTGFETRITVLGHTQRGGQPTAYDRIWATRVGAAAHDLVRAGRFGEIPVKRGDQVVPAMIADVVASARQVPAELYELARVFY